MLKTLPTPLKKMPSKIFLFFYSIGIVQIWKMQYQQDEIFVGQSFAFVFCYVDMSWNVYNSFAFVPGILFCMIFYKFLGILQVLAIFYIL